MRTHCTTSLKVKKDLKVYIVLFSCSVSRAARMELVSNLTTTEFIKNFKRLISRRGKPNNIYSDNTKPSKTGAKWLNGIKRDETFSWINIIQSDQSEYVLGRELLKDQFSCCFKQNYTVTQSQLPATLKMEKL